MYLVSFRPHSSSCWSWTCKIKPIEDQKEVGEKWLVMGLEKEVIASLASSSQAFPRPTLPTVLLA
jgi:hypothetical protein